MHLKRLVIFLPLLLALPAAAAPPSVWGESAMVKVRPNLAPRVQPELHLTAARNEFVSFQVALHGGNTGLNGVRARMNSLVGPMSIPAADVTLYRVAYLTTVRPSVPGTPVGRWPDGLVPDVDEIAGEGRRAFPFDVPAGETRAIWVDVHVPVDAPPGQYRGTVEVTSSQGAPARVGVRLTVVEATLPSTPSLATAFLVWPPHVCNAHTGSPDCPVAKQEELLARYHRMALEHRVSLSSGFPRAPQPFSAFEAVWGPFLDGTVQTRLPGARLTSFQYVGEHTAEGLADFTAGAQARGWLPRAYDFVGDEPPYGISFDALRQNAELARQVAPTLRTLVTTNSRELATHGLETLIDVAAPVVNHLDGTAPPFLGSQKATYEDFLALPGRELWMYQSCMSHGCAYGTNAPENQPGAGWPSYMVDRSAAKARAMEWVSFLEGATGELYYQTVGMLATAWTDQFRFNGNGDGTLFYPGTPAAIGGATDVPVASIRLKLIRMGVQDYEWLKAVSDAGDPAFAHKVARQLIPAASKVPDEGEAFERARKKLITRYLQLTGAPALPEEPPAPGTSPSPETPAPPSQTPAPAPGTEPVPEEASLPPPPASTGPHAPLESLAEPQAGCSTGGSTGAAGGALLLMAWLFMERRRVPARVRAPRRR
ncbi:DUF4091 domain-containing protein [Stigmatella erecta]|uniref:Myxococcales GC_trans_RRR domain-containing protein n=1 Tax=Stigmatella erecta TaxID=83460 RepID=A0A1I0KD84_9BACT|nr:DUF4091 domain-containing protein [Stigmatella erecta]SEU21552.1 Myxococcales GC_trans_RRR domain-containing protein [Stigmatella erecta]